MSYGVARDDFLGLDPSMKRPFTVSVIFHVSIFILSIVGIPYLVRKPMVIQPVSVELVNISDISQTTRVAAPQKKPEEMKDQLPPPAPEKPVTPQMKDEKPPDLTKPKEPDAKKDAKTPPPPEELKVPDKKHLPKPKEKSRKSRKSKKPPETQDFQTL